LEELFTRRDHIHGATVYRLAGHADAPRRSAAAAEQADDPVEQVALRSGHELLGSIFSTTRPPNFARRVRSFHLLF